MSETPYETLGVEPKASPEDIRKAYRRLAKELHPDLNPGDTDAEERFKRVSSAYGLLNDADKRARYDRGEIDASGAERPPQRPFYRDFAAGDGEQNPYFTEAGFADFASDDILSGLFRGGRGGARTQFRMPGADIHYRLPVDFLDAVNGGTTRITLPDGGSLDLAIPPGARDRQVLRLRGKGQPGNGGGPPGDALVEIEVRPHKFFTRDADDIRLDLPISLTEAVLGGRVPVPTPTGPVTMTIPKGSNNGRVLRLRGKGAPRPDGSRGDEYVTLRVALPPVNDPDLEAFVNEWSQKGYDPRLGIEA